LGALKDNTAAELMGLTMAMLKDNMSEFPMDD
jgi:hypothetical protein